MNLNTYLGYLYGEQLSACFYQEYGFGCVEQQAGDVTFDTVSRSLFVFKFK